MDHPILIRKRQLGLTWAEMAERVRDATGSNTTAQTLQNICRKNGRPVNAKMADLLHTAFGIPREILIYWNRPAYRNHTAERHNTQETVKEVRNGQNS